ncbi:MAG TPA: hypothetical protein VFE29_09330 [Terriglobia bacterium]|nr:hypothetical protein [Terriglobia bacterium]
MQQVEGDPVTPTVVDRFLSLFAKIHWRTGDTLSGLIVLTGTQLALSPSGFAAVNVVLVAVWLGLAFATIVRHSRAAENTATRAAA